MVMSPRFRVTDRLWVLVIFFTKFRTLEIIEDDLQIPGFKYRTFQKQISWDKNILSGIINWMRTLISNVIKNSGLPAGIRLQRGWGLLRLAPECRVLRWARARNHRKTKTNRKTYPKTDHKTNGETKANLRQRQRVLPQLSQKQRLKTELSQKMLWERKAHWRVPRRRRNLWWLWEM